MHVKISENAQILGQIAANHAARVINSAINERGGARIVVSTGASQFTMFEALLKEDVDWASVDMFHLDEYVNLPVTHPASFIKYLKERFVSRVNLKAAHFVDTTGDVPAMIARMTAELRAAPIDLGLIGIGENGHIAFNDPPADFVTTDAYKIVTLDDACRRQQLGEGWFPTFDDVPKEAVSMTVNEILKCRKIISVVPYAVKAQAVKNTLTAPQLTNLIPATALTTRPDWTLYLDNDSASLLDRS